MNDLHPQGESGKQGPLGAEGPQGVQVGDPQNTPHVDGDHSL